MEKYILNGKITLEDVECREWLGILSTKIDTINDRTKQHTKDIQELKRMLKKCSHSKHLNT